MRKSKCLDHERADEGDGRGQIMPPCGFSLEINWCDIKLCYKVIEQFIASCYHVIDSYMCRSNQKTYIKSHLCMLENDWSYGLNMSSNVCSSLHEKGASISKTFGLDWTGLYIHSPPPPLKDNINKDDTTMLYSVALFSLFFCKRNMYHIFFFAQDIYFGLKVIFKDLITSCGWWKMCD